MELKLANAAGSTGSGERSSKPTTAVDSRLRSSSSRSSARKASEPAGLP